MEVEFHYCSSPINTVLYQWMGQSSSSAKARTTQSRPNIEDIRSKRVSFFEKELKRQQALITRLEKIQVQYHGLDDESSTLIMNKGVSTPYNCAQHLSELLMKQTVVAEVNGDLWDMHRPLQEDCSLKFFPIKAQDSQQAYLVNKTFWRSCSFLLGAVVEDAFQDDISVVLHSFPSANVRSGSFVYDVQLGLDAWKPSLNDLRVFAGAFCKFTGKNHSIHRLDISPSLALAMFEDNTFKTEQIPQIAASSNSGQTVTVYRVGNHIDISRGPMISSTGLIGRFSLASVHKLHGGLYRFQGVALPSDLFLNPFAFGILESRASKLNPARIPEIPSKAEITI
nr:EOG090X0A3R [Eurycercus lamellatus]